MLDESSIPWRASQIAQSYFLSERVYLEAALRQAAGPTALQVGRMIDSSAVDELDLPNLMRMSVNANLGADLLADPAFIPFFEGTVSTVILPHALEGHEYPHQVLREAHRVLQSNGHLVLTGFNPYSLLGLQRVLARASACPGKYYSVKRVVDWLHLLGFEVVASAMFQYTPLLKPGRSKKALAFLEAAGDRWLPMFGGGYMITAKKVDVNMTLVGRANFAKTKRKLVRVAPAKSALKSK